MRRRIIWCAIVLASAMPAVTLAQPLVTGNLTYYYDFDSISTNTDGEKIFFDKSGNNFHGTIHEGDTELDADPGTVTVNTTNQKRGSGAAVLTQSTVTSDRPVYVDAHGDIVTRDFPDKLPTSGLNDKYGLSIAAWLNVTTNTMDQSVFQGRTGNGGHGAPHFQLQADGKLRMTFRDQTGTNIVNPANVFIDGTTDSGNAYPIDTWFHYAGTYDADEGVWAMYFNGKQIISGEASGFLGDWGGLKENLFATGFGAVYDSGGRRFDGMMDELYVFNRALTAAEITTLATIPPAVTGDCNGDGVLSVLDANCTDSAKVDELLGRLNVLRGDVDGNKQVEFADFLVLSSAFGNMGTYTQGDLDKNGQVEFVDFLILSSNFGKVPAAGAAGGTAAAVPEPTAGVLAIIGIAGLTKLRRSRRSKAAA